MAARWLIDKQSHQQVFLGYGDEQIREESTVETSKFRTTVFPNIQRSKTCSANVLALVWNYFDSKYREKTGPSIRTSLQSNSCFRRPLSLQLTSHQLMSQAFLVYLALQLWLKIVCSYLICCFPTFDINNTFDFGINRSLAGVKVTQSQVIQVKLEFGQVIWVKEESTWLLLCLIPKSFATRDHQLANHRLGFHRNKNGSAWTCILLNEYYIGIPFGHIWPINQSSFHRFRLHVGRSFKTLSNELSEKGLTPALHCQKLGITKHM